MENEESLELEPQGTNCFTDCKELASNRTKLIASNHINYKFLEKCTESCLNQTNSNNNIYRPHGLTYVVLLIMITMFMTTILLLVTLTIREISTHHFNSTKKYCGVLMLLVFMIICLIIF